MIAWQFKSAIQRLVSKLPFRFFWYGLVQEHITRSITVDNAAVERRLKVCRRHMEHLEERGHISSFAALEIGTGWIPIIPLGLWLCGAQAVWTLDIASLIQRRRLNLCLSILQSITQQGRLSQLLPQVRSERIEELRQTPPCPSALRCEEFLHTLGIELLVGQKQIPRIGRESIDLVVSHEVLEYVPRTDLDELFRLIAHSIRPGAIMSHYIDLRDEYSYFDASISPFNFLRYSEQEWRRHANPMFPLNRLTLPDYRNLFQRHSVRIEHEQVCRAPPTALSGIKLDQQFSEVPEEDLLALNVWIKAICSAAGPNSILTNTTDDNETKT